MSNHLQKYKIYYSSYGYVKIDNELYEKNDILPFQAVSGALSGHIKKSNLFSFINVKLKTLYGIRKLYTFSLKPDDKIGLLIKLLKEEEDNDSSLKEKMNQNQTYRLISSKGSLRELNQFSCLYEEKISQDQIIIIAPNHPNKFADKNHGNGITIESGNIAHKTMGDEVQLAFADKGYNRDTSYTEFILETEPYEKSIIIGVSLSREDYNINDITKFWGYVLSDANKISNDTQKEYGKICRL